MSKPRWEKRVPKSILSWSIVKALYVSTLCLSRFLWQTYSDSIVRILSSSRFCPDFGKIVSGVCPLSEFCPLSGFCPDFRKKLPVVWLSGRTRSRQSCPDFHSPCPPTSGFWQFRYNTVWYFSACHPEVKVETQGDCIAISKIDRKIVVDPELPLLLNSWVKRMLVDYFRLFSK